MLRVYIMDIHISMRIETMSSTKLCGGWNLFEECASNKK